RAELRLDCRRRWLRLPHPESPQAGESASLSSICRLAGPCRTRAPAPSSRHGPRTGGPNRRANRCLPDAGHTPELNAQLTIGLCTQALTGCLANLDGGRRGFVVVVPTIGLSTGGIVDERHVTGGGGRRLHVHLILVEGLSQRWRGNCDAAAEAAFADGFDDRLQLSRGFRRVVRIDNERALGSPRFG